MELIDTHAHLQWPKFDDDRDAVVERALEAGVTRILTLATDLRTSEQVIALAERYESVYAAVGVHPTDAAKAEARDFYEIAEMAAHEKVLAIGETGMDFYWETETVRQQERSFRTQMEMSVDLILPIVVHNRNAGSKIRDMLAEVADLPLRGVFHCFGEDPDLLEPVLERGCYVSFTGNLTYKNSKMPEVAEKVPIDKLLLETDSPFLTPHPHRGKRNEPAYVRHIAEKHAELRKMDLEALAVQTTANARMLFGFP